MLLLLLLLLDMDTKSAKTEYMQVKVCILYHRYAHLEWTGLGGEGEDEVGRFCGKGGKGNVENM